MVGEDGQKLCEILAPNGVNIEHVRQIDFYLQDIKKRKNQHSPIDSANKKDYIIGRTKEEIKKQNPYPKVPRIKGKSQK